MTFIPVTRQTHGLHYINSELISSIVPAPKGCSIVVGGEKLNITESMQDLVRLAGATLVGTPKQEAVTEKTAKPSAAPYGPTPTNMAELVKTEKTPKRKRIVKKEASK